MNKDRQDISELYSSMSAGNVEVVKPKAKKKGKTSEDMSELYESIYAGDAVYGDNDKDDDDEKKGKKDNDSDDVDEKDTDSSDSDNPFDKKDDNDSDDDDESEDSDDDSDEDGESKDGTPKGDGSFSTSVESLRKQYSDLLAKVFGEFAPDAIEAALDGSDGPFGDNIQTIIQTAIDHLKGMIYDEFELEELEVGIDPSAMGSFDPNAATDVPMELDIGSEPEVDEPFEDEVEEVGPELEISTVDDDKKNGLEECSKNKNKKEDMKKKASKLEECVKRFEPVNMRRVSRMSKAYNK
jgi:hypothetical protein